MMASVSTVQVMHLDCKMMPMVYVLRHACDSMHDQTGLVPPPRNPSIVCVMLVYMWVFVHYSADQQRMQHEACSSVYSLYTCCYVMP